ncbi:MAG: hypothetical protein GXP09_12205 [Gammaproteobacteria bacterium]|nr:hypothetical protein [Gammaproteobacteria bacterium]
MIPSQYLRSLGVVVFIILAVVWVLPAAAAPVCGESYREPAKGQFLVAARKMSDPRFEGTVILLLEHNKKRGTLGVIINKNTDVALTQALPKVPGLAQWKETISYGGPVALNVVIFLSRHSTPLPESGHVLDDVYSSASRVTLAKLFEENQDTTTLRLFFGHSGWAAGQLDMELERGDWHLISADPSQIFADDRSKLWPQLIDCASPRGIQANLNWSFLEVGAL